MSAETPMASPEQVARALGRLRGALARNTLRQLLGEARLRMAVIACCSIFFWASLFIFFARAFAFINTFEGFTAAIVDYAFSMYFLTVMVMLFFSVGIITYNSLFHARESEFLLTFPCSADRVFASKFVEAMAFASWGFVLIGSPLLIAYGITVGAPLMYYLLFVGYLFAFVCLPGALGAAAALIVGYFLPRRQKSALIAFLISSLALIAWVGIRVLRTPGDVFTQDWMNGLIGRLGFSQDPLWPSVWISNGLTAAAHGDLPTGFYYLLVMSTQAAAAYLLAAVIARDVYRPAFSRVQGGRVARRMRGWYGLDAAFHRAFGFVSRPIRLLILKDLRTFRRDPAQWSQFLIFFGLLGFYFLALRRLGHDTQSPAWRNLLSFLNLAVTALLLSTFTSRFVYPMLSLEGRNFWVLGLLPLRRESILWGKFAFAAGISLCATEVLVILSDIVLRVGWMMGLVHVGMIAILCFGLAGISVGLGARFPNLREHDPSKIAAGFGGTLNLLLSLVFILVVVMAIALPCHIYLADHDLPLSSLAMWSDSSFQRRIGLAVAACAALGLAATVIPMRIGMKAFRSMEL